MKRYVMIVALLACVCPAIALDWNKVDEVIAELERLEAARTLLSVIEDHDLRPSEVLVDCPDATLSEDVLRQLDLKKTWVQKIGTESQQVSAEAIRRFQVAYTQELQKAIDQLADITAQVAKRCACIELRLAKVRWCFVLRNVQALSNELILSQ